MNFLIRWNLMNLRICGMSEYVAFSASVKKGGTWKYANTIYAKQMTGLQLPGRLEPNEFEEMWNE